MSVNKELEIEISERPEGGRMKRCLRALKERYGAAQIEKWPALPYETIDLLYWRTANFVNFGDELSRTIVSLVLATKGKTIFDELAKSRQMTAIGSILHFAQDDAVVWGSGVNGSQPEWAYKFSRLDVRAVRGPYTAEFLRRRFKLNVPEVYGDPALLLPKFFDLGSLPAKQYEVGFVPNHQDLQEVFDAEFIHLINPRQSANVVVQEILKCRRIIASSLHGIIIAEAFGIPATYVRLSEKEGIIKYRDYYAGTGRYSFPIARSLPEAIEMAVFEPLVFDCQPLLEAFPFDIWKNE